MSLLLILLTAWAGSCGMILALYLAAFAFTKDSGDDGQ